MISNSGASICTEWSLRPASLTVRPSARQAFRLFTGVVAIVVLDALLASLGLPSLRLLAKPWPLAVLLGMTAILVPIPYIAERAQNRAWSATFASTGGVLLVNSDAIHLRLELHGKDDRFDLEDANAEVLLRWRLGIVKRAALSATLTDLRLTASKPHDGSSLWTLTASRELDAHATAEVTSPPVNCEVGIVVRGDRMTRKRVLEGVRKPPDRHHNSDPRT